MKLLKLSLEFEEVIDLQLYILTIVILYVYMNFT